jgi:hypothetical protein
MARREVRLTEEQSARYPVDRYMADIEHRFWPRALGEVGDPGGSAARNCASFNSSSSLRLLIGAAQRRYIIVPVCSVHW